MEIEKRSAIQIIEEIKTSGDRPLRIIANDFRIYIAKSGQGKPPTFSLINEFCCSLLLNLWDINTPGIAAININPEIIDIELTGGKSKTQYAHICFGSREVKNVVEANELFHVESKSQFRKLQSPKDLIWIALFDMWVCNIDRNPKNPNLLLAEDTESKKIKVYAIDHVQAFNFFNHKDLNPEHGVCLGINDSILDSKIGQGIRNRVKKNEMTEFQDKFWAKVQRCQKNFYNIANVIPKELGFTGCHAIFISNFLFDDMRNRTILDDFFSRL